MPSLPPSEWRTSLCVPSVHIASVYKMTPRENGGPSSLLQAQAFCRGLLPRGTIAPPALAPSSLPREVLMPIQHVGRPIKRLEDPKLITGSDPYVNDVRRGVERALWFDFTRNPHAHAVIKRIDTTAAKKMPGVVTVLTGVDVNAEVGVIHTPLAPEM